MDVDELLDRYMRLSFGAEAAPAMRAYFDRWEDVWERGGPDARYNTMRDNKDFTQMEGLTRPDIEAFDEAIAKARTADATPQETERLKYVTTYYEWVRLNADQWLLSKEFKDADWLAGRSNEDILAEAERGLAITAEFDEMTKNVILPDQTAWYWSARARGQERAVYEEFNGNVRQGVLAVFKSSIDDAFGRITSRLLEEKSSESVIAYWKTQAVKHPKISPYALTQAHLLGSGPGENLIVNGDFEDGQEEPLHVDRWGLGGLRWQGMPPVYSWEEGSGRNGGRALAAGIGRMEIISTKPVIEKDKRYRFSYWYKTTDEINPTVRLFLQGLPPWRIPVPIAPAVDKWHHWSMTFSGDDLIGGKKSSREAAIRTRLTLVEQTLHDARESLAKELDKGARTNPLRVAKTKATLEKAEAQRAQYQAMLDDVTKISDSMKMDLQFQPRTLDKDQWLWIDDVELVTVFESPR